VTGPGRPGPGCARAPSGWRLTPGPDGNLYTVGTFFRLVGGFGPDPLHGVGIRVTPSGAVSELPGRSDDIPTSGFTVGADRNLWFSEQNGDIARVDPRQSPAAGGAPVVNAASFAALAGAPSPGPLATFTDPGG